MKVAQLEGTVLDYWVGRAQGWHPTIIGDTCVEGRRTSHDLIEFRPWSPSTDWAVGGPIIEREYIVLVGCELGWCAWVNGSPTFKDKEEGRASAALVAAMRAYVSSKFGEDVSDL